MSTDPIYNSPKRPLPPLVQWTLPGRFIVFILAATSIWCLLADFYRLCPMHTFTIYILIPAMIALAGLAILDRARGDGCLWRAVVIGTIGGFIAAIAYDLFRVPFVVAAIEQSGPAWLRLPLFKVFPRFGAMILSQPFRPQQLDSEFSMSAHVVGWIYHFSNGMTFGVMYMALIGDARRRAWGWAVVMAIFLELSMLLTPYTGFFGINLTARFVAVTLMAHLIFGAVLGLWSRRAARAVARGELAVG